MSANTIQWEKDADGIVTVTLDDPNGSANVMNDDYKQSMAATVKRLVEEKDSITGVVITSAKKTFFAGGDLTKIIQIQPENAQEAFNEVEEIKADLRTLETFGRPVVAAINGAALGGGLRSRWRPITGSRPTSRDLRSVCPRYRWACCPAAAASPGLPACSVSRTAS